MPSLCRLQMIQPDLALTVSWFYLVCLLHMACTILAEPVTCNFAHYFCPCLLHHRLHEFPTHFLSCFGKANFGSPMSPCDAYRPLVMEVRHFLRYSLHKNSFQFPWWIFNLLMQVFLWCYNGVAYVFRVPCDKPTSFHYSHSIGMSSSGHHCLIWLSHMCPWSVILSLDCYCRSCNKKGGSFWVSFSL